MVLSMILITIGIFVFLLFKQILNDQNKNRRLIYTIGVVSSVSLLMCFSLKLPGNFFASQLQIPIIGIILCGITSMMVATIVSNLLEREPKNISQLIFTGGLAICVASLFLYYKGEITTIVNFLIAFVSSEFTFHMPMYAHDSSDINNTNTDRVKREKLIKHISFSSNGNRGGSNTTGNLGGSSSAGNPVGGEPRRQRTIQHLTETFHQSGQDIMRTSSLHPNRQSTMKPASISSLAKWAAPTPTFHPPLVESTVQRPRVSSAQPIVQRPRVSSSQPIVQRPTVSSSAQPIVQRPAGHVGGNRSTLMPANTVAGSSTQTTLQTPNYTLIRVNYDQVGSFFPGNTTVEIEKSRSNYITWVEQECDRLGPPRDYRFRQRAIGYMLLDIINQDNVTRPNKDSLNFYRLGILPGSNTWNLIHMCAGQYGGNLNLDGRTNSAVGNVGKRMVSGGVNYQASKDVLNELARYLIEGQ